MVLDESSVLQADAALNSAEDEGDKCFEYPVARPSRPFEDAVWTDKDHYYDGDLPTESCSIDEWKRTYRDLDEIQINGAIRRHWSKGKEEVRQVIRRARTVLGNKRPCRSDLTQHFYGPLLPLFGVFHRQLGVNHRQFLQFLSTSNRLSANNWTTVKLYNKEHPQLNVDDCMEGGEYQ